MTGSHGTVTVGGQKVAVGSWSTTAAVPPASRDETALLAAIREQPDEDTHRLAYADWLQENGQPERAEFIRVQCELARGGTCLTRAEAIERGIDLVCRERELFHADTWRNITPGPFQLVSCLPMDWYNGMSVIAVVRRGFVHSVTCTAADWLTHADAILAQHPVKAVTLTTLPEPSLIRTAFAKPSAKPAFWETEIAGKSVRLYEDEIRPLCRPTPGMADVAKAFLEKRYPGVTFTLPDAAAVLAGTAYPPTT